MTLTDQVAAPGHVEGAPEPTGVADLGAARPLRADVWRRFKRNRMAMVGMGFILLLALVAAFAPLVALNVVIKANRFHSCRSHEGTIPAGGEVEPGYAGAAALFVSIRASNSSRRRSSTVS